jgi:outer membrane usher protein
VLAVPDSGIAQRTETVVLKIILNAEDKGEHLLLLTADQDVLFPLVTLKQLGFQDVPTKGIMSEEAYVSLTALAPEVSFAIDEKASALLITADPRLLQKHVVDLEHQRSRQVAHLKQNAAFLNYALRTSLEEAFDFTSLSLPWEVGVRIGDVLGFANFSYTRTSGEDTFVRLLTSITRDDPQTLRRYTLGDIIATSGDSGGSDLFGGVSFSKNFAIIPHFIRYPGLEFSGLLRTPSDVEIYVNDLLVRKETLPPGEFSLRNLPIITGGGQTTLRIRDAYGREEYVTTPFYLSSRLLKSALDEYSYSLGFRRQGFGRKSFQYGDLAFAGFHRVGLSNTFTGGLQAEIDANIFNLGTTADFLLGTAGEMNTAVVFSHHNGRFGFRALAGYFYASGRGLNFRLSIEGTSREFASIFTDRTQTRLRGTIGVGWNLRMLGAISATYTLLDRYREADTQQMSLFYRKPLARNLSLFVVANRIEGGFRRNEVFLGLNAFLGLNKLLSLSSQVADGQAIVSTSVQQNPPLGTGIGYRLQVDTDDQAQVGGQTQLQYHGPYGIYALDYRRSREGQNHYDLTLSGDVAFINSSFYLSKPIFDSFALVKVSDLQGVKVQYNNQVVGTTNKSGELLVSQLISYLDNKLSIEPLDLPLEYSILETTKYVSTPPRGGGIVAFGVEKLRSFEGRLFFLDHGQKVPAEYAGLEITMQGTAIEHIVGKDGAFYLENLPAGTFPARLFTADKQCRFDLTIPTSDAAMVDLGDIVCEIR